MEKNLHSAAKWSRIGSLVCFIGLVVIRILFQIISLESGLWNLLMPLSKVFVIVGAVFGIAGLICIVCFGEKSRYRGRKEGIQAFVFGIACVLVWFLFMTAMMSEWQVS